MSETRATLPIEPGLPQSSPHFKFTATINFSTYDFDFQLNTAGDFWVLEITKGTKSERLFRGKVIYDMTYVFFAEGWAIYFRDPSQKETAVTQTNLGDPVLGFIVGATT